MESSLRYRSSNIQGSLGSNDSIATAIGLLRPLVVNEVSLHAGGEWAVGFPALPQVELGVLARGDCWLTLEAQDPIPLREGDFYLMTNPPPYVLASALTEAPVEARSLWAGPTRGPARIGSHDEETTYLCGGRFSFGDANAPFLLDVLPPLVIVRAGDPRGILLSHLSALLVAEIETAGEGRSLVLDHLAQILFVQMLRAHVDATGRPAGWLAVLSNDEIGAALRAMHADVAHRWTLKELASISSMSRSAFAASFKKKVGKAPLDYLIEWRMSLARDALRHGSHSISELASATGYQSESAFSTAFRRVVGTSPQHFRDAARAKVSTTRFLDDL